ncbi:MAG: hypothetical protein ACRDZ4_20330 [Egibacteraceae bacterium]
MRWGDPWRRARGWLQVSPFPQRPRTPGWLELTEALFNKMGIPVVWEDESVEERRQRAVAARDPL